jgi:mono/diheme cytochrome c family protein
MKRLTLFTICCVGAAQLLAVQPGSAAQPAASASAPASRGQTGAKTVSFKQDLGRIFRDNCTMCHQGEAPMGALDLTPDNAYAGLVGVQSAGAEMLRVAPGQPDRSYLYFKTSGKNASVNGAGFGMPWASTLSPEDLALLRGWIKAGAPNN